MQNKVKITQKEFDDIYDIEDSTKLEITGETEVTDGKLVEQPSIPAKQDTTPTLDEEEQEQDDQLFETLLEVNEE